MFDENRRFNPQFIEGSEETVDCDTVVLAIGQAADLSWIRPEDNLKLTPRGTLANRSADAWPPRGRMCLPAATWRSARESSSPPLPKASARRRSIAKFLTGRVPEPNPQGARDDLSTRDSTG